MLRPFLHTNSSKGTCLSRLPLSNSLWIVLSVCLFLLGACSSIDPSLRSNALIRLDGRPVPSSADQSVQIAQSLIRKQDYLDAFIFLERARIAYPENRAIEQLIDSLAKDIKAEREALYRQARIDEAIQFSERYKRELQLALLMSSENMAQKRKLQILERERQQSAKDLLVCADDVLDAVKESPEKDRLTTTWQQSDSSLFDTGASDSIILQDYRKKQACLLALVDLVEDREPVFASLSRVNTAVSHYSLLVEESSGSRNSKVTEKAVVETAKRDSATSLPQKSQSLSVLKREYQSIKQSYLAAIASKRFAAAIASAEQLASHPLAKEDPMASSYQNEISVLIEREVERYLLEGRRYYASGEVEAALNSWRKGLLLDPDNLSLLENVRRVELFKRNFETLSETNN